MIFWRKSFLDTLMQIFTMLQHLIAEIPRFKFDDYRVIANDLKLFWGAVYENHYVLTKNMSYVLYGHLY